MVAPQLTRAIFAYKTPTRSGNGRLGRCISVFDCNFFPNLSLHLSERFGWNATPQPAKEAPKVSRPRENPVLRRSPSHRITHPRETMDACRSTDAPPFRSEIAVAHTQSIRHAFEKSTGDGSFDKSLSAS